MRLIIPRNEISRFSGRGIVLQREHISISLFRILDLLDRLILCRSCSIVSTLVTRFCQCIRIKIYARLKSCNKIIDGISFDILHGFRIILIYNSAQQVELYSYIFSLSRKNLKFVTINLFMVWCNFYIHDST